MSSENKDPAIQVTGNVDAKPSVGAVIVNFNGGARVLRVIEALMRQTYDLAEIVVVDNNSTDGSVDRICELHPAARVLRLPSNRGLSTARNLGLRELITQLAFIVDHDIYAEDTAVESMVTAFLKYHPTVVCPRIRLVPERDIVQMQGAAIHFLGLLILRNSYQAVTALANEGCYVDAFTGGCLLLDRQAVLDAGAFDDMFFFYFEDLELALRLRLRGHRFWCEPSAEVFHEPAAGTPGLSYRRAGNYPRQRAYLTMRNRILAIFIHYRLQTIVVLLPAFALFELAAFLMACLRGWPAEWFRAWYWQLTHFREIRQRRRSALENRKCRDREVLVGGPPPLAQGFVDGRLQKQSLALFSRLVNAYWALAHRWIA